MLISTGASVKIHRWPDLATGPQLEFVPAQELAAGAAVSLCGDGSYLACVLGQGGRAQIVSVREPAHAHPVHTVGAVREVCALRFKRRTKRTLALATRRGDVVLYDTKLRAETRRLGRLSAGAAVAVDFAHDDGLLAACHDAVVTVFGAGGGEDADGAAVDEFAQASRCTTLRFHPTISNRFAVGCKSGDVSVWDAAGAARLLDFCEHTDHVTALAMPRTGDLLVTAGLDYKLAILDVNGAAAAFRMNLHLPVTAVDVTQDGRTVAAGLEDGSVCLYDLRRPHVALAHFHAHDGPVGNVCFDACARDDRTGSPEGVVAVQDAYADVHGARTTQLEPLRAVEDGSATHAKNEALEKLRNDVFRLVKSEMDDLENQMDEHCMKFQAFLNNEFDIIQNTIREKWDIFNLHKVEEKEQVSCAEE